MSVLAEYQAIAMGWRRLQYCCFSRKKIRRAAVISRFFVRFLEYHEGRELTILDSSNFYVRPSITLTSSPYIDNTNRATYCSIVCLT